MTRVRLVILFFLIGGLTGVFFTTLANLSDNKPNINSLEAIQKATTPQKIEAPKKSNTNILALQKAKENVEVKDATVVDVVDANTVKIIKDGTLSEISVIGIVNPKPSQEEDFLSCNSIESIDAIKKIIVGKKVFLVRDNSLKDENFINPPKYIFLEDLTFFNLELIKKGIGLANPLDNYQYLYSEEFQKEELIAREKEIGVWIPRCEEPIATPTPAKAASVKTETTKATATPIQSRPTKIPTDLYSNLLKTPTPTPTQTPITPTPTSQPVQANTSTAPSGSLNPEILLVLINNHRKEIGKPAFEKEDRLCSLAKQRGPELQDEIFVNHNVHSGLYNRNLPYWITENMASYSSEEQIFNWWMGSGIHRRAIEGDSKYSCGECHGNSCAQLFTSWTPK